MLKYNTMRFGTDEFNPYIRQALLVSSTPVDLSDFNRLDQISILGNQPDGSKRRFMFKMGDKVYKFDGQNAVEYTGSVTIDNVLQDGNSAAQVEAVRSNKVLVGNKIFPIIALYSDSQDSPSAKLVFTASSAIEELDSTKEMTAQYFHDADINPEGGRVDGTVLGFSWDIDTNGDASAGFKVQLLQNGEWSNYLTLTEAKGQNAQGIRSKWYYHVDAANGINSVKINKFRVHWSPYTNFNVYGDTAYLTSTVENFGVNLTGCVLVVRHEDLEGGSIDAHVSFQKKRNTVIGEVVPIVYGSNVFELAHYPIIATLKVFVDGVLTKPDDIYTASISKNCHFILNVPDGAVVTANYQYGGDDEIWLPMDADTPEPTDNGLYTSRFFLKNPYDSAKQLAVIRLTIKRGRNTNSTTRVATGSEQRVHFSHDPDEVYCDAPDWYHDQDALGTNDIVFTAPEGQTVNISYDWHGITPVITGWQAAFTC